MYTAAINYVCLFKKLLEIVDKVIKILIKNLFVVRVGNTVTPPSGNVSHVDEYATWSE